MGRYDFRPIKVLQHANQLLETGRVSHRPPWHGIVAQIPPGETIVRPAKRFEPHTSGRRKSRSRGSSRMFQPLQIIYPEDKLRTTFFGDHPWELARPRTVVESDGNDGKHWDWSQLRQPRKALDGESVVRRQLWLLNDHKRRAHEAETVLAERLSGKELKKYAARKAKTELQASGAPATAEQTEARRDEIIKEYNAQLAPLEHLLVESRDQQTLEERMYDKARKEFYALRLQQDVERQAAKEEALHYGSYFEPTANEKSMKFENDAYEEWKEWALQDIEMMKHKSASMLSGSTGAASDDDRGSLTVSDSEEAATSTS